MGGGVGGGRRDRVGGRVWVGGGDGSDLTSESVSRTLKVCLPSNSAGEIVSGLVQAVQLPASRRHWNVEPDSEELKVRTGLSALDGLDGLESSVVSGAVLSTRRFVTVLAFVLPALSVATARTSYRPSAAFVGSQVAGKGATMS